LRDAEYRNAMLRATRHATHPPKLALESFAKAIGNQRENVRFRDACRRMRRGAGLALFLPNYSDAVICRAKQEHSSLEEKREEF
jgi:hypothetical protein